jgi:putative pyruvate formate lyase activating enzyme
MIAKVLWARLHELMNEGVPISAIEFTNPTESIAAVIEILSAPDAFNLLVVLKCHLHGTEHFYEVAAPIADVWNADLRYGNDKCAKVLSGVDHYMKYARIGLDAMTEQCARVIVRILILPGHVSCCHGPAIELLSEYREKVWVSILDQYVPEHQAHLDSNLKRRPTKEEIARVKSLVDHYGLRDIDSECDDFWKD